jgi:hypothetical protein
MAFIEYNWRVRVKHEKSHKKMSKIQRNCHLFPDDSAVVRASDRLLPSAKTPAPARFRSLPSPLPRVSDCAVIQTGTPSRFACNGKVYTSYQLAKLREDEAKRYAAAK